ncbi:ATP-dependent DNA ligase [Terrabacter sp. 2RAF25]|uniref:ATP-dependent DNA ligase n=1 Tax=Terrabacter sp. 2RAF25 TaxID=3232998 RepID=UPI003F9E4ED2
MAVVSLHAPVALVRAVDDLTPSGVKKMVWEPKWDGYRALVGSGRILSRNGTDLTPLFPDLAPVLTSRLPDDLVLDGEVIAWDPAAGRLDFEGLQARMTAGRPIRALASRRPAQLVVFDVLAAGSEDLRGRPLRERRAVLEQALAGIASPIVLCQQTDDLALAKEWFHTLTAGGIEGLVIKDAGDTYPPNPVNVWWKVKAKQTLDMIAIGFTGDGTAPTALVLAFPGKVDDDGQPVTAGSTTSLSKAVGRSLSPLLHPTGETFERTFAWGSAAPTQVTVVAPFVVEVEADASAAAGGAAPCRATAPRQTRSRPARCRAPRLSLPARRSHEPRANSQAALSSGELRIGSTSRLWSDTERVAEADWAAWRTTGFGSSTGRRETFGVSVAI